MNVWFSITSTLPNRCRSAAIWLASCGPEEENVATSWAVPKPAVAGTCVSVATAAPTKVAATATMISARISSCWRHSRRSSRQAHLITARRAARPPLAATPREAGRSHSAMLTGLPRRPPLQLG